MGRLSDTAIEIINELHTERLDYYSEYIPLIDAANSLAAYEDTGLEPDQVMELKSFTQGGIHKVDDGWKHVQDLLQAEKEARLVALPCKVGDTVWLLKKKCKYAGEDNDPWCSCDQYWDNVYHKHMWGCAGKDDEGKQFDCEKRDMEWYAQQIEYSLALYSPNIVLGKNLFLTREEAEAALAQEGGTNEDSGSL